MEDKVTGDDGVVRMKVKRVISRPEEPPRVASKFNFVGIGPDVQFEIGHLDLVELKEHLDSSKSKPGKKSGGSPGTISLYVTDRFRISPTAALELLAVVQAMVAHLERVGALVREEDDASGVSGDGSDDQL